MLVYTRGDRIPAELRDDRFTYQGETSAIALKKYWRLLPNGQPDPACPPYRAKWEIDLHHRAYPELGEYRVDVGAVGRPRGKTATRKALQVEYYQQRKIQ